MRQPDAYLIEPERFEQLRELNKRLFNDMKSLSPDDRRDLANALCVWLDEIEKMPYYLLDPTLPVGSDEEESE